MKDDNSEGKDIGETVRRFREARNLDPGQLAAFATVSPAWLSRLEAGQIPKPSGEMLAKIARVLAVSVDAILRGELPPRMRTAQEILRELEAATPILVPETRYPASAGPGVIGEGEYWPYYPSPTERSHSFIAVPVSGTCMEPRIREGEIVIVDKDSSPQLGDVVVAVHDGDNLVKILQQCDDAYWLVALQDQPPIRVDERTLIIGVVRMAMHRP